jgi:hypothetical protein
MPAVNRLSWWEGRFMSHTDRGSVRRSRLAGASLLLAAALCALLSIPSPATAQLGPACFAEVLNRAVRIDVDGSFYFSNLPSEPGNFRVRVTCTPDGGGVFRGQSPFFQFVPNGVIEIGPIAFGAISPIPAALELRLAKLTLTAKGEPLDLVTTGILGDGTEVDFSAIEMGTEFWSAMGGRSLSCGLTSAAACSSRRGSRAC